MASNKECESVRKQLSQQAAWSGKRKRIRFEIKCGHKKSNLSNVSGLVVP